MSNLPPFRLIEEMKVEALDTGVTLIISVTVRIRPGVLRAAGSVSIPASGSWADQVLIYPALNAALVNADGTLVDVVNAPTTAMERIVDTDTYQFAWGIATGLIGGGHYAVAVGPASDVGGIDQSSWLSAAESLIVD